MVSAVGVLACTSASSFLGAGLWDCSHSPQQGSLAPPWSSVLTGS